MSRYLRKIISKSINHILAVNVILSPIISTPADLRDSAFKVGRQEVQDSNLGPASLTYCRQQNYSST